VSSAATTLATFSREFGEPFLRGGVCIAGAPLGYDGFLAVRHGLSIDAPLAAACADQLGQAALYGDVTPAPFDDDAATLLYAVHELFCATHPDTAAFFARAESYCTVAQQAVEQLPVTLDGGRLMTRHLIVRRALMATRTDVHVKWWTGNASFHGEAVPKRLLSWPSLRGVKREQQTTPLWQLTKLHGDAHIRMARQELWRALLDASPLTRLLSVAAPVQKLLPFSLAMPRTIGGKRVSSLDALEDRRVARLVVDHWMNTGFDKAGACLALALLQGLREGVPPRMLRRCAELCTHLALTAALIESQHPGAAEAESLRQFLTKDPSSLTETDRIYWAVVGATLALAQRGHFELPTMEDAPVAMRQLLQRLAKRVAQHKILAVAEPLLRELSRRLTRVADVDNAAHVSTEPSPAVLDAGLGLILDNARIEQAHQDAEPPTAADGDVTSVADVPADNTP
jgi:hypothetical protein